MKIDPSTAFAAKAYTHNFPNGREPRLGGQLRQHAVWVDESTCIGCRYCANVATNTFVMEPRHGRSRAIRQDGDSTEIIQEAIDTCPVDCIHWVRFEELDALRTQLREFQFQPLGMLPKLKKRIKPLSNSN